MAGSLINYHKFYRIARISFRSLLQHKLRTTLSVLGVICGAMAVLAMISIGEGGKQKVLAQIEQLGIRNIYVTSIPLTEGQKSRAREQLSPGLNLGDARRIRAGCRHVTGAASLKELKAAAFSVASDFLPQIVACSSTYATLLNLSVLEGRFISDTDIAHGNLVCVLGDQVARSLGKVGRPGEYIRIEGHLFKIVGILQRLHRDTEETAVMSVRDYNEMIFLPMGSLDGDVGLSEIVVQVRTAEAVMGSGEIIERVMQVAHHGVNDYQVIIPQELLRQTQKTQRIFNIVLSTIASISLLVGGIGIMNIMLATVSERTKEIGIRRAIGATRTDIVFQFLMESMMLTGAGGLIGILAGTLTVYVLAGITKWNIQISSLAVFLPLGMSIFVGIFFGLYPAYQAAQMDPVAAIRHD